MRILHVNDAAGVAGCLAKYQSRMGLSVAVVCRGGYDMSKQEEFYHVHLLGSKHHNIFERVINVLSFYCYVAWVSRSFDVIHVHSQYLVGFFLPFKRVVYEFHGSDVRLYPQRRWGIDSAVTSLFLKLNGGFSD